MVLKLFNIVQPQVAVFGKKDYQQLHIIRELVQQLNFPVEDRRGETVRASDNLASSSRNRYLTNEERAESTRLYQVLLRVKQRVENGNRNFSEIGGKRKGKFCAPMDGRSITLPCGIAIRWLHASECDRKMVVLGAARLGKTRLIDNLEMEDKSDRRPGLNKSQVSA